MLSSSVSGCDPKHELPGGTGNSIIAPWEQPHPPPVSFQPRAGRFPPTRGNLPPTLGNFPAKPGTLPTTFRQPSSHAREPSSHARAAFLPRPETFQPPPGNLPATRGSLPATRGNKPATAGQKRSRTRIMCVKFCKNVSEVMVVGWGWGGLLNDCGPKSAHGARFFIKFER